MLFAKWRSSAAIRKRIERLRAESVLLGLELKDRGDLVKHWSLGGPLTVPDGSPERAEPLRQRDWQPGDPVRMPAGD